MKQPAERTAEVMLWIVAIASAGLSASSYRAATKRVAVDMSPFPAAVSLRTLDAKSLAAAADDVVEANLFRPERAPADSVSGPESVRPLPQSAVPPKPHLELRGVIGGPPWEAIVAGIPGRPNGAVVTTGEVIAGLKIHSIGRDAIIVTGSDTIWHLTLGRP